jgi:hypothetical protein
VAAGLRIEPVAPITTVGGLLIDCEQDRTLQAVLVGMLPQAERSGPFLGGMHREHMIRSGIDSGTSA